MTGVWPGQSRGTEDTKDLKKTLTLTGAFLGVLFELLYLKSKLLNSFTVYRQKLVELIDKLDQGTISWDQFEIKVKLHHENRLGGPYQRLSGRSPRHEEYFYANPLPGCLCRRNTKD
jgi:hypothetical protein